MRTRDLRTGLVVDVRGKRGVTTLRDGTLAIEYYSIYGGEGFNFVQTIDPRDIKLVLRIYKKEQSSNLKTNAKRRKARRAESKLKEWVRNHIG